MASQKQSYEMTVQDDKFKKGSITKSVEHPIMKTLSPRVRFRAIVRKVIDNREWLVGDGTEEDEEDAGNLAKLNRVMLRKRNKDRKGLLTLPEKAILMKDASERSYDEKRRICFVIGGLKCFRRYPEAVQRELASITYFVFYHPNREVVRQGHHATALYFILDGLVTVTVTVLDPYNGAMVTKEVGTMSDGDMFGEVSLLHGIPRTATITTAANCNMLFMKREDFERILKASLQEQWDQCLKGMQQFPYFDRWSNLAIRECCILSKLKNFKTNEIIIGHAVSQSPFVFFVLSGECDVVEALVVRVRYVRGVPSYRQYETGKSLLAPDETLQTFYMQVCTLTKGSCFYLGEHSKERTVVAGAPTECLLCPRYWIMQNNRAKMWERVQKFMNENIPSSKKLFEEFVEQRKWLRYRKSLAADARAKRHIKSGTRRTELPHSIRLKEHDKSGRPGFYTRGSQLVTRVTSLEIRTAFLLEKNKALWK